MISKETAMENIRQTCMERLNSIYCAGIPDFAVKRFEREFAALEGSDTVIEFEAYRAVAQAARRMSIPMVTSNGTFLAYLLGFMGVNPLPAHYYCPKCGKSECTDNYSIFGIDLKKKECSCGNKFISMGIAIPFECVWGDERQMKLQDLTIRSSYALVPFAEKALCDLFGNDKVVTFGIKQRKQDGSPNIYWTMGGFAVLPENVDKESLTDEICWLENGEECIDANYVYQNDLMHMSFLSIAVLDILYECQNRTGIFAADITYNELSEFTYRSLLGLGEIFGMSVLYDIIKPETKREMCRVFSAAHSSADQIKDGEQFADSIKVWLESDTFKNYPFIEREDFFNFLIENGVSIEDAAVSTQYFRRGRSLRKEFKEVLEKYDLSDDFYETAGQFRYSPPRYHSAAFIYTYLLLAKYSKYDRKMYLNVLNKFSSDIRGRR